MATSVPNGSQPTQNGTKSVSKCPKREEHGHKFASFHHPSDLRVNGVQVPHTMVNIPADQHIREVREMDMRDDDILVYAYAKSGTHWIYEIVRMLVYSCTEHVPEGKEFQMIDFCQVSQVDAQVSPRVLNSHLAPAHLPKQIVDKKTKIVHVVRNPKDIIVSLYHHFGNYGSFNFQELLDVYMEGSMEFTNQFRFLRHFSEFQKQYPDHPVKTIFYEDMKKDPSKITEELAEFLGVPFTKELCDKIAKACDFENLKAFDKFKVVPEHFTEFRKKVIGQKGVTKLQLYRKGTVGDWKNHFTVAQNELFDSFIEQELQDLDYKFTYTL